MQTGFYEAITRSRKADSTKMLFLKVLDEDVILKQIKTRDKVL